MSRIEYKFTFRLCTRVDVQVLHTACDRVIVFAVSTVVKRNYASRLTYEEFLLRVKLEFAETETETEKKENS